MKVLKPTQNLHKKMQKNAKTCEEKMKILKPTQNIHKKIQKNVKKNEGFKTYTKYTQENAKKCIFLCRFCLLGRWEI